MKAVAVIFGLIAIGMVVIFAVAILFPEVLKHEDKYLNNK